MALTTKEIIIKRAIAVGLTALTLTGITATNAFAAGVVYNQVASNGKVIVKGDGNQLEDVWPGRSSQWMGITDADYFWVPGGCDAWSQYGYKYVGNKWYGPMSNSANLSLKVIC